MLVGWHVELDVIEGKQADRWGKRDSGFIRVGERESDRPKSSGARLALRTSGATLLSVLLADYMSLLIHNSVRRSRVRKDGMPE